MGRALIAGIVALFVPAQILAETPYAPVAGEVVLLEEANGFGAVAKFDIGDAGPFGTIRTEPEIGHRYSDDGRMHVLGLTLSGGLPVSQLSSLADAAFGMTFGARARPYLSLGIGAANGTQKRDTVFAAGAAVGFHVSDKVILFSGYRLFGTTDPKLGGLRAGYHRHSFVAGLRVLF